MKRSVSSRVARPDAGAEAERRGVREPDRFVGIFDAEERRDGAERLLGVRRRGFGDVGQHRRRVEVAARPQGACRR